MDAYAPSHRVQHNPPGGGMLGRRGNQLDQVHEALQGHRAVIDSNEFNERLSPASSVSSEIQDLAESTVRGSGKLKKRSTSTSSGLKSLGRIFGSRKNKNADMR